MIIVPKVSVIIPVYNVEQYLRQCLDSVCNQTFKDIEIIIVNDCSTDNSLQILEEYKEKDKRIILIDLKQNIGVGFVRNEGMKYAKGEYIIFVDPDDWVKENFVEILYNSIKKYNTDFVSVNYIYIHKKESINHKIKSNNLCNFIISDEKIKKEVLLNIPSIQVWTKIFNRDFLVKNNIKFLINKIEDVLFIWEIIIKSTSFIFLEDALYYHRVNRKNSIMSSSDLELVDYNFYLFSNLQLMLKQTDYYNKYNASLNTYMYIWLINFFEKRKLNYKKGKDVFVRFRTLFYDKRYELNYENINYIAKIKLFILKVHLKFNINYMFFGKVYYFCKRVVRKFV